MWKQFQSNVIKQNSTSMAEIKSWNNFVQSVWNWMDWCRKIVRNCIELKGEEESKRGGRREQEKKKISAVGFFLLSVDRKIGSICTHTYVAQPHRTPKFLSFKSIFHILSVFFGHRCRFVATILNTFFFTWEKNKCVPWMTREKNAAD